MSVRTKKLKHRLLLRSQAFGALMRHTANRLAHPRPVTLEKNYHKVTPKRRCAFKV